jgi:hypothetical protein
MNKSLQTGMRFRDNNYVETIDIAVCRNAIEVARGLGDVDPERQIVSQFPIWEVLAFNIP